MADGEGLALLVKPNGSKLWWLRYRHLGKEKTLSLGPYPEVSLQTARRLRDEARGKIALGEDPSLERRKAKEAAKADREHSFAALASAYMEKQRKEGRAAATLAKNQWLLDMAMTDLGPLSVSEIKAPQILAALKRVEARGTYETANRLRSIIGTVMRYGMAMGWLDADPTPALRGALVRAQPTPRAAITDPMAFGGLLRAIDDFQGQAATRIGLQLMALLFPRPGELRQATWNEFDLTVGVWTIPAERMKMRESHRAPLPAAAVAHLEELHALNGHWDYIFPSIRSARRPMSENTLNAALRRMGYTKDEMTAHGFRASFSTMANESGLWRSDAIERALAHIETNDVRRAYARGDYWDERVRMADWWARRLDEMKVGK